MKKTYYFVRHGESEGNAGPVFQTEDSPLSLKGREQAEVIAQRLSRVSIDKMISSTQLRARQTAEIVMKQLHKPAEYSDLLIERRRPSSQVGMLRDSPVSLEIDRAVRGNFGTPGYRHSDEETYADLIERARQALAFLVALGENHVAVVTHGLFLRVLLGQAIFGEHMDPDICQDLLRSMKTDNTGLFVFEYDTEKTEWSVKSWNDLVHIA